MQHVAKISFKSYMGEHFILLKSLEGYMMNNNITVGGGWHNSDVIPQEFKHCVFEISISGEKEVLRSR